MIKYGMVWYKFGALLSRALPPPPYRSNRSPTPAAHGTGMVLYGMVLHGTVRCDTVWYEHGPVLSRGT